MSVRSAKGEVMAVALSPWPPATSAVALETSRNCLRTEALSGTCLRTPPQLGRLQAYRRMAVIDRLGGTAASALVEAFAPSGAPQPVKDEAVIRESLDILRTAFRT